MMNRYDEIKKYLNIIREQMDKRVDIGKDIEDKIEDDTEKGPANKRKKYRISNKILAIYGSDNQETQITDLEKNAFVETIKEFQNDVTDLVEFNELNLYEDNVEWSGKLTEYNINFIFTISENFGVYIYTENPDNNLNLVKLDQNTIEFMQKLVAYFNKFKSKWGDVLAARK